jgi:uncharacterized Zn-binding protein involved in type VI secretion
LVRKRKETSKILSKYREHSMRAIIRKGDPTSHGGQVIEGSPFNICEGKEIAFVGHKVVCPRCKGVFPIIEGMPTTILYNKGVALEGMKTACGASLIATQFFTKVAYSNGGSSVTPSSSGSGQNSSSGLDATSGASASNASTSYVSKDNSYDQHFVLIDQKTQQPCANQRYRLTQGGHIMQGRTDANGKTQLVSGDGPEQIKIEIFAAGEEE